MPLKLGEYSAAFILVESKTLLSKTAVTTPVKLRLYQGALNNLRMYSSFYSNYLY